MRTHEVSHKDRRRAHEGTANTTAALPAGILGKTDTSAPLAAEREVWGVDELPSGSAVLVVKRGPNAGSRFGLDKPVTTAGRHPSSDIFLDDVTVSRQHAEFRSENGEYQVVDANSLNGTYVNRKAVDSALLAHGDEIRIGNFCLVFLTRRTTDRDRGTDTETASSQAGEQPMF